MAGLRIAALLGAWPLCALAGVFGVDPVRVVLPGGAMSTQLSVENRGDAPLVVQSELAAWSQSEGREVLLPSRDLVISPPIFRVAPGATQTVRIGLLRPNETTKELTYRLFLQEVPSAAPTGQVAVTARLRVGVPLFVLPRAPAAPAPRWSLKRGDKETLDLSLTNRGNAHIQVIDCKLVDPRGDTVAEQALSGYVLQGQTRSWNLKPSRPWRQEKLKLIGRTERGEVTAELSPD